MNHKVVLLYSWAVWAFTFFLPDIPFIMRFRGRLYGLAMKQVGENFQVSSGARLYGIEKLICGSDVYIATNVVINAGATIELENEVMIGISSVIVSGNHSINNGSFRFGEAIRKPIKIGFGSWVSGNALVTSGAELPPSSLLAGGAVLNKAFTEPGIYGGVPAKYIKKIIN